MVGRGGSIVEFFRVVWVVISFMGSWGFYGVLGRVRGVRLEREVFFGLSYVG